MTQERYRNGAADITELLGAEAAATSARSLSVAARYDRAIAAAGLRRATGAYQAAGEEEG
jgi:outer membrane protein TolC